jgi:hypothetical protein
MDCVYNRDGVTCCCFTDGLTECRYKAKTLPEVPGTMPDTMQGSWELPHRTFDTGATRDLDDGKYDYEAFLSPLVIEAFGRYMHRKRKMPDGSLRAGDNWQKGIPLDSYMKSGWRHFMDWWGDHRLNRSEVVEEALCALMFNVMGYLHTHLKAEGKRDV